MDTAPNYKLVGGFLSLALIAIVVALVWLTGSGNEYNKTYRVRFKQASLAGLQKDSYVTMKGITIGSVKDYEISANDIEQVLVTIQLSDDAPVKTTTRALISRNLLTGIAQIELVGGKQNDPELAILPSASPPVIPEGTSTIEQITDSIPELLNDISEVTAALKQFASKENSDSLTQTIQNLEKTTRWFSEKQELLDATLTSFSTIGTEAKGISKSVSGIAERTDASIASMTKDLSDILSQLHSVSKLLNEQLQEVGNSISGTSQTMNREIVEMSRNIDHAAAAIAAAAENLENPNSILTGPNPEALGPGER